MKLSQVQTHVESTLNSEWTATQIAWENVDYNPEDGPWIRATVVFGESFGTEKGDATNACGIRTGQVIVQVFVPSGSGTRKATNMAHTLERIFRLRSFENSLHFQEPYTLKIGDDGYGFYQVNVHAPFHAWITGE